jgi:hypothetical protein
VDGSLPAGPPPKELNGRMTGSASVQDLRTGTATAAGTDDALLGMLFPFWQLVIGCCVLLAMVAAGFRLARRGPSRMGTALLVIGGGIVALVVVGILTGGR